ncbi:hypothetical protein K4F52_001843 [Lecanicillium sp. MT-2017a]|nr:hypothetical protein K4F52_001843 [Lecanicillium sp. MT-2017a]
MKFSILTAALFALSTNALTIVPRDLQTIKGVFDLIQGDIIDSTNKAVAWLTDPNPPEALLDSATKLINDVKDSKGVVEPTSKLSLADTLQLVTPVQELNKKAEALRSAFKDLRPKFSKDNVCDIVRDQFTILYDGGQALIDTIMSKVPPVAISVAKPQADKFIKTLNDAKVDFNEQNCIDAIDQE